MTESVPPNDRKPATVSNNFLRLMAGIVIAMAIIALYANVQKWRRSRIETVTLTPPAATAGSPGSNLNSNNH